MALLFRITVILLYNLRFKMFLREIGVGLFLIGTHLFVKYVYIYIYIYIGTHLFVKYVYIYIYIYI